MQVKKEWIIFIANAAAKSWDKARKVGDRSCGLKSLLPSKCWFKIKIFHWRRQKSRPFFYTTFMVGLVKMKEFIWGIWVTVLVLGMHAKYDFFSNSSSEICHDLYEDGNISPGVITEVKYLVLNQFLARSNLLGSGKCCCKKVGTMQRSLRYPFPLPRCMLITMGVKL